MARQLKVVYLNQNGDPETDLIAGVGSFDQENNVLLVYSDRAGEQLYKMYSAGLWATAEWVPE